MSTYLIYAKGKQAWAIPEDRPKQRIQAQGQTQKAALAALVGSVMNGSDPNITLALDPSIAQPDTILQMFPEDGFVETMCCGKSAYRNVEVVWQ